MSCCGSKRAALSARGKNGTAPSVQQPSSPAFAADGGALPGPSGPGRRRLVYLGSTPLALTGPRSGVAYYVDAGAPTLEVRDVDVASLLKSQLFAEAPLEVPAAV